MEQPRQPPPPSDRGSVLIAASIIAAALVLSWGMSSSEPRYQLAASGDTVVRMDTDSGEMIACGRQSCARVQAPDRARTFGPLTVQFDSAEGEALPPPEPQRNTP